MSVELTITEIHKLSSIARKQRVIQAIYDDTVCQWMIIGKTFPKMAQLKAVGAYWDKKWGVYRYDGTALPNEVAMLLDVVINEEEQPKKEKPAPQPIETPVLPSWFVPPSWWKVLNMFLKLKRAAIAITGPAGNGKTTAAEMAMKAHGIEYHMISCTESTLELHLTGGMMIRRDGEEYVEGLVTDAFRRGMGVILDEADALDPRVMMCLQTATLDAGPDNSSRFVNTPAGKVYPTGACPIILAMNTLGTGTSRQYTGRNKLDAAALDRISFIKTTYENEERILMGHGFSSYTARYLVRWAEQIRRKAENNAVPIVLSPRTLKRMAECIERFSMTIEEAAEIEFFSRVDDQFAQYLR